MKICPGVTGEGCDNRIDDQEELCGECWEVLKLEGRRNYPEFTEE